MAKATTEHSEDAPGHEAVLAGVVFLAGLFSNCVEAFGLIHPSHRWEKEEQLLLTKLGIQQARLLIWGDIMGISSPPKSVTDRAVPKHPSAAYPDLKEPTFFVARDSRLDDTDTRKAIEDALNAIVDRSSMVTREQMMEKYGLKPPKRFATEYQPALDTNRLEGFREKYELLQEVAETYANLNTRRKNSIIQTAWTIADNTKFASFIKLTQDKIDYLINSMDVKDRVDRGMRMDIKSLGWHLSADRARVAQDTSKLRLVKESCENEYPEYIGATQQALDNIAREARENMPQYNPYESKKAAAKTTELPTPPQSPTKESNGTPQKQKRPGLFGRMFGKSSHNALKSRSASVSTQGGSDQPERSQSDSGPSRPMNDDEDYAPLESIRSKSVGDIQNIDSEILRNRLAQLSTNDTVKEPLTDTEDVTSAISRHDQYHGIGRVATKDMSQA